MEKTSQLPVTNFSTADGSEFMEFFLKLIRYWYWFLISLVICIFCAFLYLRYSTPTYKISSKILIKDDKGGSSSTPDILSDLDLFNVKNNVDNEKEILQTRYLLRKVVDELHLNINYYADGNIKSTELYKNCPFKVNILYLQDSVPTQKFHFQFSDANNFILKTDSSSIAYRISDTIKTPVIVFTVQLIPGINLSNNTYTVNINTPDATTDIYLYNLTTDITSKQASVIQMTLEETVPKKGEDILNKLYEVYTRINQDDKNKIADSTINFIDGRLALVADELSGVEKNIEEFKKVNDLSTNFEEQARLTLGNASDVQKQLVQQQVEINVLESIEDHLNGSSLRIVPSASTIQDPTYISSVEKYNSLVLERDRQLETTKENNPLIQNLNSQIINVKNDLLISLNNIKKGMVISKRELEKKNNELLGQLKSAPSKERAFLDISRQQDVKQQLYLYLLQKREETAISKSGTLTNSRLIEPAKSDQLPFNPKRSLIYLFAFCIAIFIPSSFLYLKELLNNKISDKKEIIKNSSVPIAGELGHNDSGETFVVKQDSRTALSEQFRVIRSNLQFILKGREHQVILFTSSMSGEGKSFLSINIALSLAISGKKVVIVEMDLRKPRISKEFGIPNEAGFTDFIVSNLKIENLAKQTLAHANLFIINSGTLPPNPAELLLHEKVAVFFAFLKEKYDYIIVDTPPVGLVTDATIIGKYADATLYIIRQKFTYKSQIQILNDLYGNEKIPNISILVNDVKLNGFYGYSYGYGRSGDNYYSDAKSGKWLNKKLK